MTLYNERYFLADNSIVKSFQTGKNFGTRVKCIQVTKISSIKNISQFIYILLNFRLLTAVYTNDVLQCVHSITFMRQMDDVEENLGSTILNVIAVKSTVSFPTNCVANISVAYFYISHFHYSVDKFKKLLCYGR